MLVVGEVVPDEEEPPGLVAGPEPGKDVECPQRVLDALGPADHGKRALGSVALGKAEAFEPHLVGNDMHARHLGERGYGPLDQLPNVVADEDHVRHLRPVDQVRLG